MCVDPVTAMTAASTITQGIGAVVQGQGEAAVDKANAKAALYEGYSKEAAQRREGRAAIASQLATLSTRGVSLQAGSPLDLLAGSARNNELNALTIRTNAKNEAAAYRAKASAALQNGWFGAAGALLGGATKLAQLGAMGKGTADPGLSTVNVTPDVNGAYASSYGGT